MGQRDDGLLLFSHMEAMKEIFAIRAGIEIAGHRDAPRLQFSFLRCQDLIAEYHRLVCILLIAGRPEQIDRGDGAEGNSLQLIFLAVDFRQRWRCFETSDGELPILFGGGEAAIRQLWIAVFQHAGGERLDRGHSKIPFRIVDGRTESVVGVAHDSVGPIADQLAGGAIAVAKARLQHPVQAPLRFEDQPVIEDRVFPLLLEALG